MKVILKPISHPEIGNISIDDTVFPIGRREEPFSSQHGDVVSKLSRRHARVFQEGGKVYVADMGSLNGTQVNNRPVQKRATLLHAGDDVNFGGQLSFRVEIEDEADEAGIFDAAVQPRPVSLTLMPVDTNSGIEAIVVSQFPFLIRRTDGVFGRYKERYPDDVRQLSRRHAVISRKGEQVYVEDLGSVNGTYVSGERLDEHAKLLRDGDAIAFGGDRFSYTVRLQKADQDEGITGTMLASADKTSKALDESRTTFVNSAASFLDIFCAEDDELDLEANAAAARQGPASTAAESGKPGGRIQRTRALAGEVRQALDSGGKTDRKAMLVGGALLGLILAGAGFFYWSNVDRREIRELLDAGNYAESAAVGNRWLAHHPDDEEASTWALQALLKANVPEWLELIKQGRYDAAVQRLAAAAGQGESIQGTQEMIDTLAWAGRVEAHMADRGGANGPIVIFKDELPVKELVAQWNANPQKHQQVLTQVAAYVPDFEPLQTQVLSDLRTLRNENSLYGKAIAELKSSIRLSVQKGHFEDIYSTISDFAGKYPRVSGLDALSNDARHYQKLSRDVQQQDLAGVSRLQTEYQFQTPLFRQLATERLAQSLPPADAVAGYEAAADAWLAGDESKAIALLEPLRDKPWGELATRRIERYRRVAADYRGLQDSREDAHYRDRLFAFRTSLDPTSDAYFLDATEADFASFRQESLPRLKELFKDARKQWEAYRDAGGIPGVGRVEAGVSQSFRTQAGRLSAAYKDVSEGSRTYRLIGETPPADWQSLRKDITNEAVRQRRSLQELKLVLEPALLRAKLDLLPEIKEVEQ
jgi:pSer/pThr/pTyr-binding forkhead associated (FHA) protein